MTDVVCALDAKAFLGEGPLWDVSEQVLYWVDIKRHEIHRFDPAGGKDQKWSTHEDIGCLAVREQGGLVVAMTKGFYFFDLATGESRHIVNPEPERTENRFNDGKPDRQGRFWAGSEHDPETQPTGALYRLDPDGACQRMIDGVICSNALCWSPDNRTLYYSDTYQHTVWAFDFDPLNGTVGKRRDFVKLPESDGPDGATIDAEGYLWLAVWGGWRIDRYDPEGRLDRRIELPVECPTCPAFGGPNLDVIYVTSASNKLTTDPAKQPLAGGIFAIDAGVKGLPEARFRG